MPIRLQEALGPYPVVQLHLDRPVLVGVNDVADRRRVVGHAFRFRPVERNGQAHFALPRLSGLAASAAISLSGPAGERVTIVQSRPLGIREGRSTRHRGQDGADPVSFRRCLHVVQWCIPGVEQFGSQAQDTVGSALQLLGQAVGEALTALSGPGPGLGMVHRVGDDGDDGHDGADNEDDCHPDRTL
jgi:hypothetical protein